MRFTCGITFSCDRSSAESGRPSPRVVIAEDEALIRLDLAEMLAEEGYDVVGQAGDGEEASRARRGPPSRPRRHGRQDAQARRHRGGLADRRPAIAPVVMLTAFSQRDLVERARDAGAMAYLVKPFNKTDLVPAIEMAMCRFAEITALEHEVADLTEQLETRKVIERAKGCCRTRADRARGIPLDPAHRDGPAALDASRSRKA